MKYSVVSQIRAVDRDSDGMSDHFYFGDLGGQVLAIYNNSKGVGDTLRKTPTKILNSIMAQVVRVFMKCLHFQLIH
jgi:type IV pilus assembly protein PilY1